jgi:transcriptional regulator of arginine metabolism
MKLKSHRQETIRKIISKGNIHSQDELLQALKSEGFELTQATLSRDLKILQVAKITDRLRGYKYTIQDETIGAVKVGINPSNFIVDGFREIEFSGNIAIIKTLPGYASSIASLIDNAKPNEILGTIAGDDTIMLVIREGFQKEDIINSLILIMPNLKNKFA